MPTKAPPPNSRVWSIYPSLPKYHKPQSQSNFAPHRPSQLTIKPSTMASLPGLHSSSGGSGSRASGAAQIAIDRAYKDVIITSEWYFKSAGYIDLIERFRASLAKHCMNDPAMVLTCGWIDSKHWFELKCRHDIATAAQTLFVKAMIELIAEEEEKNGIKGSQKRKGRGSNGSDSDTDSDDDSDSDIDSDFDTGYLGSVFNDLTPLVSDKIQRLSFILAQRNLPSTPTRASAWPPRIALCKEKFEWTSCTGGLEYVLPLHTKDQLIAMTGCVIVRDLDASVVFLGARELEQIHQAVARLDIILKYSDQPSPLPLVCHVFYTESTDDFELSLKYLQDVKIKGKRFFETTLLDPKSTKLHLGASEDGIHWGVTVRCATLDEQGSYKPLVKSTAIGSEPVIDFVREPWTRFSYNPRGTKDPARHFVDKPVHVEPPTPKLSVSASEVSLKNQDQDPPILPNDTKALIPVDQKIENWQATVEATKIPGGTPLSELALRPNMNLNGKARGSWDLCEGSLTPRFENTIRAGEHLGISGRAIVRPTQVQSIQYMQTAASNTQANNANQTSTNSPMTLAQRVAVNGVPVRPNDFPSLPGANVSQPQRNATACSSSSSIHTNGTIPSSTVTVHSAVPPSHTSAAMMTSPKPSGTSQVPAKVAPGVLSIKVNGKVSKVSKPASTTTNPTASQQNSLNFQQTGPTPTSALQPMPQSVARVQNAMSAPAPNARSTMSIMDQDNDLLEYECLHSEPDSRQFYHMMNQKAGKKRPNGNQKKNPFAGRLEAPEFPVPARAKPITPLPVKQDPGPISEFTQKVDQYFEELLTGLRGFRGKIHIRVEFGRVLLNNVKPIHIADNEIPDLTLSEKELRQIIEPGPNAYKGAIRPNTHFTNVLTTAAKEIDGLLSTTSKGILLWERKVENWGVVYEFMFRDPKSGGLFSIEIDGERFKAKIKVLGEFGDIFVHGTKRHWDCRISATGDDGNTNPEHTERYGGLVNVLLATLYIPESTQAVAKFELDPATSEQFPSLGARVHRYTTHLSNDGRSVLTITEVIPLKTKKCRIDDHVIFIGEEAKPGEDSKSLKNWFVVSIESSGANKLLEQNEKLELGEEAGWTPETMANTEVTKDLYLPACAMLTSMDRIGYHNSNGLVVIPYPKRVLLSEPAQVPPSVVGYW